MKEIGIIPARMASSRFPGKPLHPLNGKPMLWHVIERVRDFEFDALLVATPDAEIHDYVLAGWEGLEVLPVMTSDTHERALDRVAEAAGRFAGDDRIYCIQADEPLITTDVLDLLQISTAFDEISVLLAPITSETDWRDLNTVKVVTDELQRVLYTSRAPIPHADVFDVSLNARRIGGMFAMPKRELDIFTEMPPSPLELAESCDMNRWLDAGIRVEAVTLDDRPYYSVDCPADVARVEAALAEMAKSGPESATEALSGTTPRGKPPRRVCASYTARFDGFS